jgi:hypothetical protein
MMAEIARVRIVKSYVLDVFVPLNEVRDEMAVVDDEGLEEAIMDYAQEELWEVKWPDNVHQDDASVDYCEVADRWEEK